MYRPPADDDTQPQQVVRADPTPAQARRAIGGLASALLVRGVLSAAATVILLVAAVLLFRNGIRVDRFPSFVAGTDHTDITRYSGPWIAAAFVATLVAAVILTLGVVDLVRRLRLRPARIPGRPRDLGPTGPIPGA